MEWIKFYTSKWLYGSGRNMTAEKRGVWADLLALAGETKFRDGSLRFEVNQPMPRDYIANILRISIDLLNTSIIAFQGDINTEDGQPRVQIWPDGTIYLTNFKSFQGKPEKIIKSEAKQRAIDKALKTKRRKEVALEREIENVNQQNTARKMSKHAPVYDLLDQNKFINVDTGEVFDNESDYLKSIQGGK